MGEAKPIIVAGRDVSWLVFAGLFLLNFFLVAMGWISEMWFVSDTCMLGAVLFWWVSNRDETDEEE